ncbi:CvpA family protein [Candidatus Omnitrophota bacterium]
MEEILSKVGVVDIVLFVTLLIGIIIGFIKGFSRQIGKIINLCLSIIIALVLYQRVAQFVYSRTIMQQPVAESLALFVLLILSLIIVKLFLMIVSKIVTIQFVYFVERLGGALLGALRYVLLLCYMAHLVLLWPSDYIESFFTEKSYSGSVMMEVIPKVKVSTDAFKAAVRSKYFSQEESGVTEENITSAPVTE